MTLTEEQRAALKRVVAYMDEMYAIASPYHGCTEDANTLRAMIDGSGTVEPVGGFDLERAREAIEEAVDRLSQKIGDEDGPIWEKEPEKAAVLQTLPDEIAHLEKWMIKNRDAATELQYQLDDAIKEDERLRSAIKTYREREESAFSEIKMKDEFLMRQNARIQELEDVHKRSGVKYAKIINELRSSVYANIPGLKKQWDEILNTPANDKIGPSEEQIRAKMAELPSTPGPYRPAIREEAIRQLDVKPQVWQITEERRDAIMKMSSIRTIIFCPDCGASMEFIDIVEPMAVLRGMLEEVA